jgi:hypothetical protein
MKHFFTSLLQPTTWRLYALLVCWLLSQFSFAQCPSFDMNLSSQEQVNNFPAGCSVIRGSLVISGDKITDLRPLRNVQSVGVDLQITDTQLTSLQGLEKLTSVGYDLRIRDNELLTSLHGLDKLTNVGYNLRVINNTQLTSIASLSALKQTGFDL